MPTYDEYIEALIARVSNLTGGTADLSEALDQWENERQALGELFESNQALTLAAKQCETAMTLAEQVIAAVEKDAAMFITPATRSKIETFHNQVRLMAKRQKENPHVP